MNSSLLKGFIPDQLLSEIDKYADKFGLNTDLRLAHFLSQIGAETNFKSKRESFNYTSQRLLKIFPKYFNQDNLVYYIGKPEKIANHVYANRLGNSDEKSGDGFKFRGSGFLQLTGRYNYYLFGKEVGIDFLNNPELIEQDYPLTSALWFFKVNQLWKICDKGKGFVVVKELTKKINGGVNGLQERYELFNKFKEILKII